MEDKLVGRLRLSVEELKKDVIASNKILADIKDTNINLKIMDTKTAKDSIDNIKLIKTEIDNLTKLGMDTSKVKEFANSLTSQFANITKVIQQVTTNAKDAQTQISKVFSVNPTTNQTTVATTKKDSNGITTSSIKQDTDDYKSLANAMARVHDQSASNIQQRASDLISQESRSLAQEANDENKIGDAINRTVRAREQERLTLAQNQATAINRNLESEYAERVKLTAQIERQSLASLSLYTQERSETSQYNAMSKTLSKISGDSSLAMSSSNAGASMGDRFKVSSIYTATSVAIYSMRSAFKDAIKTNEDYELGLNDLKRVLGDVTSNDLKSFGAQAIQFAKDFGEPISEVQKAMSALAAAGVQDKNDLSSMTKTIMMGVNTSNIKDAAQMTDYLVSSMKQLNMSLSDSEKVLDSWNYLADKHVAKTSDFAEATSKAGAASLAMGVDLNHLNAMTALLSDRIGVSGNEMGTAIRSMESKLETPKALKVLQQYGIEAKADATHFRDFGAIMTDVNAAMNKFGENSTQGNDIMSAIGGNLRKNWITILAQNYNQVDDIAKQSADSMGYSATKSSAIMDTLAKKVETFNATIKQMYISFGEGGIVNELKGIVSGATSMANAVATANPAIKEMLILLPQVAIAAKIFSMSLNIFTGKNLTQTLDKMNMSFNAFGKSFNLGGATMSTKAFESASLSLQSQIIAGNITAKESAAILEVVGEKLGIASTSTITMSAAQGALDTRLASGVAVQARLDEQLAAGTITRAEYNAEMLQRMFTEEELTTQLAAHTITEESYNMALTQRTALETSLNGQVTAGTLTQVQADAVLKTKIITTEQYNVLLAAQTEEIVGVTASENGKIASDLALDASQKSVATSAMGMNMAIGGVVVAITAVVGVIMYLSSQQKELKDRIKSLSSDLKQEQNDISKTNELLQQQSEIMNKKNPTNEEKQKLHDVEVSLAEALPGATTGFDNEGKAMATNLEVTKKLAEAKKDLAEKTALATIEASKPNNIADELKNTETQMKSLEDYFNGTLKAKKADLGGLSGNMIGKVFVPGNIDTQAAKAYATLEKTYKDDKTALDDYNTAVGVYNQLGKKQFDTVTYTTNATDTNTTSTNANTNALDANGKAIGDAATGEDSLYSQITAANAAFEASTTKIEFYNKALADLDKDHKLSNANVKEMFKDYPELINYMDSEVDMRKKIQSLRDVEMQKQKEDYAEEKQLQYDSMTQEEKDKVDIINKKLDLDTQYYTKNISGNKELLQKFRDMYGINLTDYKSLAQLKNSVDTKLIENLGSSWSKYFTYVSDQNGNMLASVDTTKMFGDAVLDTSINGGKSAFDDKGILSLSDNMAKAKADAAKYNSEVKSIKLDLGTAGLDFSAINLGNTTGTGSSGSNSAEKDQNNALILKDRYFQLNQELTKTQNLLDINSALQSDADANNNIKEKISLQQKEIALLKDKQVAEQNITTEQTKERNELSMNLRGSGVKFDGQYQNSNPLNANIILQQKLDDMNAHRNDKDKTYYNQLKTAYDDYNTTLTRFFALENTEIPKSKAEWSSLASEISKTGKTINDEVTAAENTLITANEAAIKSAESSVINLLKQKYTELQALEETRHTLALKNITDEQTAFNKFIDDKLKAINDESSATDYTTGLKTLVDDKAKVQAQSDALLLNSTQESIAQRYTLGLDLATKQKAIDDYQAKHNLDLRKAALDDQKTANDKTVTSATDTETTIYDAHKKALEDDLTATKINAEAQQAILTGVYTDSTGMITNLQTGLVTFENNFGSGLTILGKKIKTELIDNLKTTMGLANSGYNTSLANTTGRTVFGNSIDLASARSIMGSIAGISFEDVNSTSKQLKQGDIVVGGSAVTGSYTDSLINSAGATRIAGTDRDETAAKLRAYKTTLGYANGGIVTENQFAMLHGKTANSSFEAVLNEPQLKTLISDTLQAFTTTYAPPMTYLPKLNMPDMSSFQGGNQQSTSNTFGSFLTINGNVDAVTFPQLKQFVEENVAKLSANSQLNNIKKNGTFSASMIR